MRQRHPHHITARGGTDRAQPGQDGPGLHRRARAAAVGGRRAPADGEPGPPRLSRHRSGGDPRGGTARMPGRQGTGLHHRRRPGPGWRRGHLADRDLARRTGADRAPCRATTPRIRGGSGAWWTAHSDPNDYEYVDATLTRLLEHVTAEPDGAAQPCHGPAPVCEVGAGDRRGTAGPARRLGRGRWLSEAASRCGAICPTAAARDQQVNRRTGSRRAPRLEPSTGATGLRDRRSGDRLRRRLRATHAPRRGHHYRRPGIQHPVATRIPGPRPAPWVLPAVRCRTTAGPTPRRGGPRRATARTSM